MSSRNILLCLSAAVLLILPREHAPGATAAPLDALSGEALYRQRCATCHGAQLQGGNAGSLTDGDWKYGSARSHIFRNAKYGIEQVGMPAFGDTLDDQTIHRVLDYLLAMEQEENAPPPPLPETLRTLDYRVKVEVFAVGLDVPWGIAFADRQRAFITERPGRLRMVEQGRLLPEPVAGTPEVLNAGQGGLLDVAVDPGHATNGWVYLAYSHALPGDPAPAMTRIVRGHIRDHTWEDQEVLFEAPHDTYRTTRHHYGSRIVFDPSGHLYFAIGDRGGREQAQEVNRPNGKIHRIHPDGGIPTNNPFANDRAALPSIFSYGHRNPQGMAVHPATGNLWISEHGPMGGDELNVVARAANYGWPILSYGRHYNGKVLTRERVRPGMVSPVWYWRPSTAVCGMDFYRGDEFPYWRNHLLVGALKFEDVRLLEIRHGRVLHEEIILKNAGRVRDVECGPDGAIYVVLNGPGTVLRLTSLGETEY